MSTETPDHTLAPSNTQSVLEKLADDFQFDDADVIIRAREVDFRVHKVVLCLASPIFKDIFSIPPEKTSQEDTPVVGVTDDPHAIHDVLCFCYPNTSDPILDNFPAIHRVLLVLRKYEMEALHKRVGLLLEEMAQQSPIRAYAIACSAGLQDVARNAARRTLTRPATELVSNSVPEYRTLPTETFVKLLRYHAQCRTLAKAKAQVQATIDPNTVSEFAWYKCQSNETICPRGSYSFSLRRGGLDWGAPVSISPRKWWLEYLGEIQAKLAVQPFSVGYADNELLDRCSRSLKCRSCSLTCIDDLLKLGKQIQQQVRAEIDKVDLGLTDSDFVV